MGGLYTWRMSETRFLLIRHAESTWNAQRRWQGQGDPPLSPAGQHQAAQLGQRLRALPIDILLASDLARAAQTAEVVGEVLGLDPRPDPRLRELDIGHWSGLTRKEIAERDGETLARFDGGDPDVRPGGAESRREVATRVHSALTAEARAHPGACIAVVTHLGVIRSLHPGSVLANVEWCRIPAKDLGSGRALVPGSGSGFDL